MDKFKNSLKKAVLGIAVLVLPMLVGCSHNPMALNPELKSLDTHTKSVAIFTILVKNEIKPSFGVTPRLMTVKSSQSEVTQFLLEGDWQGSGGAVQLNLTNTETREFPVSLGLAPGRYTIGQVRGEGVNFRELYTKLP